MGKLPPNTNAVTAVMVPWTNAQKPMQDIVRWLNFDYGQTLQAHNNSVPWVATWVMTSLRGEYPIDEALLMTAFMAHDHGEPGSGGDEHANNKTPGKEIKEWEVYMEDTEHLPEPMREYVRKAFLIQYVRKQEHPDEPWPHPLIASVAKVRASYIIEPAVWDLIEWMDYLFTAVDGFQKKVKTEEEGMLEHCFGNYARKLDVLVREFPGFSMVWNQLLRDWIESLVQEELQRDAFKRSN